MPRLAVIVLGTYLKKKKHGSYSGPHEEEMRNLVYQLKGTFGSDLIEHSLHPPPAAQRIAGCSHAASYIAACFAVGRDIILDCFGMVGRPVAIVPMPSSSTTPETIGTRWSALWLAEALARVGLGVAMPCLAYRKAHKSKLANNGVGLKPRELFEELLIVQEPPKDHAILFVDDLLTHGSHFASADYRLGRGRWRGALAVATTDSATVDDCYDARIRCVSYTVQPKGDWWVSVDEAPGEEDAKAYSFNQ